MFQKMLVNSLVKFKATLKQTKKQKNQLSFTFVISQMPEQKQYLHNVFGFSFLFFHNFHIWF